jgi:hypothetical protein
LLSPQLRRRNAKRQNSQKKVFGSSGKAKRIPLSVSARYASPFWLSVIFCWYIGIFSLFPYAPCPKSQGIKQLMAGGGIILLSQVLIPLLANLFG